MFNCRILSFFANALSCFHCITNRNTSAATPNNNAFGMSVLPTIRLCIMHYMILIDICVAIWMHLLSDKSIVENNHYTCCYWQSECHANKKHPYPHWLFLFVSRTCSLGFSCGTFACMYIPATHANDNTLRMITDTYRYTLSHTLRNPPSRAQCLT